MEKNRKTATRLGAYTAISGSIIMLIGAALWGTSGTDLWATLDGGDLAAYLVASGAVKTQLVANLTFWIVGVLILSLTGWVLADLSPQNSLFSTATRACYSTAVPMVVISYLAMLSVVVQIAPDASATAIAIAEVIGWIGVRADDIATALMIGVGPLFISLAGKGDWVPRWLQRWSYITTALGLFSIVVLYFPGMVKYGFMVIPAGVFWMIAAGIVLLRHARSLEQ